MYKLLSLKCQGAQVVRFSKEKIYNSSSLRRSLFQKVHNYYAPVIDVEDLPQKYDSKKVVQGRCKWWKDKDLFAPSGDCEKKIFSLLLPPPNVTGTLHIGHALTATIQDVLVKWHRMCGHDVLWIPGTDHAGIATQVIVEKNMQRMGWTRHNLGREPFLKEVVAWQKKHSGAIDLQLKELGFSLHWPMYYFTMDKDRTYAVKEAFIRLFNSGLMYRKKALVNWCCHLESSISDIEVETRSLKGKTTLQVPGYDRPVEFGTLFKFAYKVCDTTDEEVVVATTRPETMFADVAVAVHPSDVRYSHLRESHLWHPYREEKIPIIFDESVDPAFGTGAVKITPGHSFVDFEIGERHKLAMLTCISEKGNLTDVCGIFNGQKRFEGRKLLLDDMSERQILRGSESHDVDLPVCSRSGDVIEILLKPQWFLKMERLANEALEAVESGELQLEPAKYNDDWRRWMSNCRDWNVSRQIWWGQRIPLFRLKSDTSDTAKWVAAHDEAEAKLLLPKSEGGEDDLYQDEDVLDTWFSSSLLPFSSLGWPNKVRLGSSDANGKFFIPAEIATELEMCVPGSIARFGDFRNFEFKYIRNGLMDKFQRYYPLSMMITGHDILFFWVARMVMLGKELTGVLPFKKVLLHSIMCDSRGKKMSKSLGNVISPENVIEGISLKQLQSQVDNAVEMCAISQTDGKLSKKILLQDFPNGITTCGVDVLRMALCTKDIRNTYMSFHLPSYETNLFFCNKIWQACRFYKLSLDANSESTERPKLESLNLSVIDHWILSCLANVVTNLDANFRDARIDHCFQALQYFLRYQLCDIFIEACKPRFAAGGDDKLAALTTLSICLETYLILLTPFAPYLTEALYGHLPWKKTNYESILGAAYPKPEEWKTWLNPSLEEELQVIFNVVSAIRDIKQRSGVNTREQCNVVIETANPTLEQYVPQMNDLIRRLTHCQISKVILRPELRVDKLSATDSLIGDDVLVHVNISDARIQKGYHERQVKAAALMRRQRKLLGNIEEIESRIEKGTNKGKTFNENHHLNVKLAEWKKILEENKLELDCMLEDLKNRNEPTPSIEPMKHSDKKTEREGQEAEMRSAPS